MPSQESQRFSAGLSFTCLSVSESSHFSSVNTGLYRSFLTNLLYPVLHGLCFLVPASTSAYSVSPGADVPEGWAPKGLVIICDNFVLNTFDILFLLLILTAISISVSPYLLYSCFLGWQGCWEQRRWQYTKKTQGKIKQKFGFFCDTELLES